MGLDIASRTDTGEDSGVSVKATVANGVYTAYLFPAKTRKYDRDHYVADALFSPRNQSESVLALVGKDGEHLAGGKVKERFVFRILEAEKTADLRIK